MPQHDTDWHALIGGKKHGPMSRTQVMAYLRDGTLEESDFVWRPGFEEWVRLREVHELAHPPIRGPAQAPPLPAVELSKTGKVDQKWSLWGAACAGLALSTFTLWTSGLAEGGYMLANFGYWPNVELISNLIGRLSFGPLLFVLIAMTRNAVRHRSLRPSSVSAGRRAAAFFGVLIAIAISLWVFGTFYFSRDEIINGKARADIVNSFATGCFRSQRAATVNAGATDAQIDGYCNCIANSATSTLTYKQLGVGNFMPNVLKAAEQVAPSCKAKSLG